jgi:hypothetical protein
MVHRGYFYTERLVSRLLYRLDFIVLLASFLDFDRRHRYFGLVLLVFDMHLGNDRRHLQGALIDSVTQG